MSLREWPGKVTVVAKYRPLKQGVAGNMLGAPIESTAQLTVSGRCADHVLLKIKEHFHKQIVTDKVGVDLVLTISPVDWLPVGEIPNAVVDL